MGLFEWLGFGKKAKKASEEPQQDPLAPYAGMRVEVTRTDGQFLFVAKLMYPRKSQGELHQYSETAIPISSEEPVPVRIRGYSDHERKAVYMEAVAHPEPKYIWLVSGLTVEKIENARAFYRLDTDLEATAVMVSGALAEERPCRLLNISIGGAGIFSECAYHVGDKFLLKVTLLEDRPQSVMLCEILRVLESEREGYEYGCQFLELKEKISQNIFDIQRKKRM